MLPLFTHRLCLLAVLLVPVVLSPAVASAKDGDLRQGVLLTDFADLEALVQRVERDGLKALPLKEFVPDLPKGLTISPRKATKATDESFRERWQQAYVKVCRMLFAALRARAGIPGPVLSAKEASKLKPRELRKRFRTVLKALKKTKRKDPGAKEGLALLKVALPRINQLLDHILYKTPTGLATKRRKYIARFKKRYELGRNTAAVKVRGTSNIVVQLNATLWDSVVRGEVDTWRFKALTDARKKPVALGRKKIVFAERMRTGKLRANLRLLTNLEYFTVAYVNVGEVKDGVAIGAPETMIAVVGARLLFGFYYFLSYDDKLVVLREPNPLSHAKTKVKRNTQAKGTKQRR